MKNLDQIFTKINNHIATLSAFSNIKIIVGVPDEDAETKIPIKLKDEFETEVELTVDEILYLTEHGSIYTPPRPVISTITNWAVKQIKLFFNKIVNNYSYTVDNLVGDLKILENEINAHIPILLTIYSKEVEFVNTLAENKEQDKGSFVPNEILKKYIKCKIFLKEK